MITWLAIATRYGDAGCEGAGSQVIMFLCVSGKRWLLLLGLFGFLAVLGVSVYLLMPRSAINRGSFEKIRVGMTHTEVESIMGGPGRNDATGGLELNPPCKIPPFPDDLTEIVQFPSDPDPQMMRNTWASDAFIAFVEFDDDGRVKQVQGVPVARVHRLTLIEKVRRAVGF